ncbi:MAG: molecular chaperone DnaK, partial [Synergistaceae bacterium]|nr:molecular chaperone DnaK [Synergistaceae bacterium]
KMTAEEKGKVNAKLDELRRAIEDNDGAKMKSAKEELEQTIQEFSVRLYQGAGSSGGGGDGGTTTAGASSSATDGETVDAEFTDQGQA